MSTIMNRSALSATALNASSGAVPRRMPTPLLRKWSPVSPAGRGRKLVVTQAFQNEPTHHRVIVICGYGPGISSAVATLFGSKGFRVALMSRTQARLDKAAEELKHHGVTTVGYAVDLAEPQQVKAAMERVARELGPVTVLFYNPTSHSWGDILGMEVDTIAANMSHQITGLVAAVQAVVPGQATQRGAAILVTGGALALCAENHAMAKAACRMGGIAVAAGKAAQRSLVHTLAEELRPKGIRVAEVVVQGGVKGSASVGDKGSILPEDVAADFWRLYEQGLDGPVSVTRA